MMLHKLPTIIFYPLLLIWSVIYGGIAGFIFKIFQVYENWQAINHKHIYLWKKYPCRSYRSYIEGMWAPQIQGKAIEHAEYEKIQLEKSYPEQPFPLASLLLNSVFMAFITPFVAISGFYYGPLHVFTTQVALHNSQNFKSTVTEYNN